MKERNYIKNNDNEAVTDLSDDLINGYAVLESIYMVSDVDNQ